MAKPDAEPLVLGQPTITPSRASQRFDPRDRSQLAMYWRAHDQIADRLNAYCALQNGPNPITEEEFRQLQAKRPDRWGGLPYLQPKGGA